MNKKHLYLFGFIFLLLSACITIPENYYTVSYQVRIANLTEHNIFIQFYYLPRRSEILRTNRFIIMNNSTTRHFLRIADIWSDPRDNLIKFTIIDRDARKVLKRVDNMHGLFIFENQTISETRTRSRNYNIRTTNRFIFTITDEWLNS